jgi:integrase
MTTPEARKRQAPRRMIFTPRSLESLAAGDRRITIFDERCAGLGVTIQPTGRKSYFHLRSVRGRPVRKVIGTVGEITLEDARGKAAEMNTALGRWKLDDYQTPNPLHQSREPRLIDVISRYLDQRIAPHSARPEKARDRILWMVTRYFSSWQSRLMGSVTRMDVMELHSSIARDYGKIIANRCVELIRTLYSWAIKAGLWLGQNPAAKIELFPEEERSRFLQPSEMPHFFEALEKMNNPDFKAFVELSLWTGARKHDLLSMSWEDVSLADRQWRIPHPKGEAPYTCVLIPEAVEILAGRKQSASGSPWVFPSTSASGHIEDLKGAWKRFVRLAGLRNLRPHDLRRTLGSWQAGAGANLPLIAKSLGHRSLDATAVYSRVNLDPVRKSVMTATRAMIRAAKPKLLKEKGGG